MTTDATSAEQEIAEVLEDLYDAYRANDQTRFDSHLSPEVTAWESYFERLYSRGDLDRFREQRAAAGTRPTRSELYADILRTDVWGDTALVRYLLVGRASADAEPETKRVTEVMRKTDGRWLIVHRHAESHAG